MSRHSRTASGPLLPQLPHLLLALVAGLAQAASLAWPGSGQPLWWLQLVSMVVLAWLVRPAASAGSGLRTVRWQRGAILGGVFGTAWLAGTFWWLFISMHS